MLEARKKKTIKQTNQNNPKRKISSNQHIQKYKKPTKNVQIYKRLAITLIQKAGIGLGLLSVVLIEWP